MRVAYVCNTYPAISNTFIMREVDALRRLGVEIDTIAIHRPLREHLISDADRAADRTTYAVLPARLPDLLGAHLAALGSNPRRYLATLLLALRLAPPGPRATMWQLFYFAEAMIVWRRCERRGIRRLHAHFSFVATDVALLAAHFGGDGWSWSFTVHGPNEFYDLSHNRLAEKVRRAAFVVAISDFARSQLMAFVEEEHWPKLRVVHCGIDTNAFDAAPRPTRDGLHVLSVGRLTQIKGQAVLIEALATLADRGIDVRATLFGWGPKHEELQRLVERLGLAERVSLPGPVSQDEIRTHYEGADVFCLPSFAEGVPIVLMEAMAMRLPVIATRITGIPELIDHGRSGLLVPPGRPDLVADALEMLARDPELRTRLGEAGREKVVEEFETVRSAEALYAILTGSAPQRQAVPA